MGRELPYENTLENIDPRDYVEFATKIGQDVVGMSFYDSPLRSVDGNGALAPLSFRVESRTDLKRVNTRIYATSTIALRSWTAT
jgi:hypothetical protein